MRKPDDKPVALFFADLHLSSKPPVARSTEADWFAVMARALSQIRDLADKHKIPAICCGDVFDKWHSSPELINFALEYLPDRLYSVPGQHDLPYHCHDQIHKSAYHSLELAGKLVTLRPYDMASSLILKLGSEQDIHVFGIPYGKPLHPPPPTGARGAVLAAHHYVWSGKHGYDGAPTTRFVGNLQVLRQWKVAFFGDNHDGFFQYVGDSMIVNCGTVIRRRILEQAYTPKVWLLTEGLNVISVKLDTSEDTKFLASTDPVDNEMGLHCLELLEDLEQLKTTGIDFDVMIERAMARANLRVRRILLRAME